MPRALADTWPEAERRVAGRVRAVPVGSTDQHGPHLRLSRETGTAVALVEESTRRRPGAVGAPCGSSGEHAAFPGIPSIGRETTELVLVELGRSASATCSGVVVCAHGGNRAPVGRAEQRLREDGVDQLVCVVDEVVASLDAAAARRA